MLLQLVKPYWYVSLLRESPANTPYSFFILAVSVVIFYIVMISQWSMVVTEKPITLPVMLLSGGLLIFSYTLYTYIILTLFNVPSRMIQTLSCLLACHTVVHFFAFPLMLLMPLLANDTLPYALGLLMAMTYLIMTIGLTVWQFLITVHIYKAALSIENISAILAVIGLFATNILAISVLH